MGRFFLYIFPTYHSWWLFVIQLFLVYVITQTGADSRVAGLVGFVAFDHGLPYYNTLGSGWERFSIGLFDGLNVRANGLTIITQSQLAPALR